MWAHNETRPSAPFVEVPERVPWNPRAANVCHTTSRRRTGEERRSGSPKAIEKNLRKSLVTPMFIPISMKNPHQQSSGFFNINIMGILNVNPLICQSSTILSPLLLNPQKVSRREENIRAGRTAPKSMSFVQDVLTVIGMTDPPEIYVEESSQFFLPWSMFEDIWLRCFFLYFSEGWRKTTNQISGWILLFCWYLLVFVGWGSAEGRPGRCWSIWWRETQETREIEIDCPGRGKFLALRHYKKSPKNRPYIEGENVKAVFQSWDWASMKWNGSDWCQGRDSNIGDIGRF